MIESLCKISWIILAYCSLLGLNYSSGSGFYFSGIAFVFILLFLYLAYKENWRFSAGLLIPGRDLLISCIGLIVLTVIIYFFIMSITGNNEIIYVPHVISGKGELYFYTVFQTINEEIMMGAVLLFSLRKKFGKIHPLFLSVVTAAVFFIVHYIVYRYLFSIGGGILEFPALISLFSVGIIRNNLILSFNHIAYSWMLHLSWNLIFFGGTYHYNGKKLIEADLCNLFYGNEYFIIITIMLAVISTLIFLCRNKGMQNEHYH